MKNLSLLAVKRLYVLQYEEHLHLLSRVTFKYWWHFEEGSY